MTIWHCHNIFITSYRSMIYNWLGIKKKYTKTGLCHTGGLRSTGLDHKRLAVRSTDFSLQVVNFRIFKQGRDRIRSALILSQLLTQFMSRIPNWKNNGLYLLLLRTSALSRDFGRRVWPIYKSPLHQKTKHSGECQYVNKAAAKALYLER